MASFTVTVTVLTHDGRTLVATRTPTIPPDYADRDIKHFYAQQVEATAHDLIRNQGDPDWVAPFLRAALLNDARMTLIERLIQGWPEASPERQAVMAIILKDEEELLAEAGPPDEG
jgi:hypothetical protein